MLVHAGLTLVATGTLTIAMAHAAKGNMVTLPRTINYSTGKNSMHQTGFSDATWGDISCSYTQSACGLGDKKFSSIIDDAQVFMKRTCAHNMTTDGTEANNLEEDEWACLSSSKSGCESIHFTSSP